MSKVSSVAGEGRRLRVCFVVTVPESVTAFLLDHLRALCAEHEVTVVSNFSTGFLVLPEGVRQISVPMVRPISPFGDMRALGQLWWVLRAGGYDVVHSLTPKAGLLTGIAARLAGIGTRIHWFMGQVWVTRNGVMRALLKMTDRITASNATHLMTVSASERDFLVAERVLSAGKVTILSQGSVCGVDTARFRPDAQARCKVRAAHGVPEAATLLLFVGRLNVDKGLLELAQAFVELAAMCPDLHLMVVGPDEEDIWPRFLETSRRYADRLHRADFTREPESFMAAADIFCLPSHREGFGLVLIEAASCGVPSVASRIYGITDAVADEETGLLFPVHDVAGLVRSVFRLVGSPELRHKLGGAARRRALQDFSREALVLALLEYYRGLPC